jgi:hypothetical protein
LIFVVEEAAMLAEIFFLRLESVMRASEDAGRPKNPRFVPLAPDAFSGAREKQIRDNGKHI